MPSRRLLLALAAAAALACGEPPVRSADPAAHAPETIFFEGFESDDFVSHFHDSFRAENFDLVKERRSVFEGNSSLRVTFREGKHTGGALSYKFREAGREEPEELYGRYYIRLGADWDPGKGGKLPGPAGTYGKAGWGGRRANGKNGWSARMGFSTAKSDAAKTQVHYYVYHPESGRYGSWYYWKRGAGMLERERWYCIETYVKLNTPGETDGVLRGWVDGNLAFEKVNLRFRDVPELKIEQFWIDLYYGGGDKSPREMHVYLDNVALSSKPIGPMKRAE